MSMCYQTGESKANKEIDSRKSGNEYPKVK